MTRFAILLVLVGFGEMALAATPATVDEVEQLLAASHGQSDSALAKKLSDLELTERATTIRLLNWRSQFPGKHTQEALTALADASAFLDLPASDVPSTPRPSHIEMQQIISRAVDYAGSTMHRLPNVTAHRNTTYFDTLSSLDETISRGQLPDSLYERILQQPTEGFPLHAVQTSVLVVAYRNGHEVVDAPKKPGSEAAWADAELTTHGEFGPVLSTVMTDTAHGSVSWSHWEQGAKGPRAVFGYSVPKEASHYEVAFADEKPQKPAYHGEIAIEPSNGTILRISLVAEMEPPVFLDPKRALEWNPRLPVEARRAEIVVEYGPVTLGDVVYLCPVRGIAFSNVPFATTKKIYSRRDSGIFTVLISPESYLNDVSFTDYHLFRGDVRILDADACEVRPNKPVDCSASY